MPVLLMSQNGAVTRKPTIAAAIASGDIAKKILIVTTDQTIDDVTISATTELQILNGAVITVNSGKTLTISGEFQKPTYSCFAGAGTVVIPTGGPGATQDYSVKALTTAGLTILGAALNEKQGADIASATTTDIGAATGSYTKVSGVTTITGLGTVQAGTRRIVEFSGILTLTHNATSLILPTGANITTAVGDVATFVSLGSGNWKCVGYVRYVQAPAACSLAGTVGTMVAGAETTVSFTLADIDPATMHSTTVNNTRITIPSGRGITYARIDASMTAVWSATAGTGTTYISVYKGGSLVATVDLPASLIAPSAGVTPSTLSLAVPLDACTATNYYEVKVKNNSSQSISVGTVKFAVTCFE